MKTKTKMKPNNLQHLRKNAILIGNEKLIDSILIYFIMNARVLGLIYISICFFFLIVDLILKALILLYAD